MSIHYRLVENKLRGEKGLYKASVFAIRNVKMEIIIEHMMRHGSTVTKADILSVLEDFFRIVEELVLDGYSVSTPLAHFGASIKGRFTGREDSFDANRHQLRPLVNPGPRLRKAIVQRGQLQKDEAQVPIPNPTDYVDINSGMTNEVITPGGMGHLLGRRLKVDLDDPNQGIFLIAADGTTTRVSVVGQNTSRLLVFLVPPTLAPGSYTLEVRTIFRGGSELRTGLLSRQLTVALPEPPILLVPGEE